MVKPGARIAGWPCGQVLGWPWTAGSWSNYLQWSGCVLEHLTCGRAVNLDGWLVVGRLASGQAVC